MHLSSESINIAIIGSGPVGIEIAVKARKAGLNVIIFDKGPIASTIQNYFPIGTELFSHSDLLAIKDIPFLTSGQRKPIKDEYIAYLISVCRSNDLKVRAFEQVDTIEQIGDRFRLFTSRTNFEERSDRSQILQSYIADFVVLAVGNLHTSRTLGITGEDLPHVNYIMQDPFYYAGSSVAIIGGRHSAITAALRLSSLCQSVTVLYQRDQLDRNRIKPWLLSEFESRVSRNEIRFLTNHIATEITPGAIYATNTSTNSQVILRPIDFTLLQIGFAQEKTLFNQIGIQLIGPELAPMHNHETMETNISGIFVAGTAIAGDQLNGAQVYIETSHIHCDRIISTILDRLINRS